MKKLPVWISILLTAAMLAACSGGQTARGTRSGSPGTQQGTAAGGAQMSDAMLLALGTFKLEDTDQAVTAAQAKNLLPLWKAVKSIGASDTAAQAEIDALYRQIKESMTSEQWKAIQAMNLTMQDAQTIMAQVGAMETTSSSSSSSSNDSFGPPGGGDPMMGGMGGPPEMQNSNSSSNSSAANPNTMMNKMVVQLAKPLVELLKERASS